MQVSYKRYMNRNYMILSQEKETNYQLKMMCENKIKGLLNTHICTFNGQGEIYYDISSRQPLSRLYAKKEISAEDIRLILCSVNEVLNEVKKFLLDGSDIIFAPDFCYCNPETGKAEWLLYPEKQEKNDFMELAEFLIERVNHSDCYAVDVAYRFFKKAKEDNFIIADFVEEVLTDESTDEVIEEEVLGCEEIPIPVSDINSEKLLPIKEKVKTYITNKLKSIISIPERTPIKDMKSDLGKLWDNYGLDKNYSGETLVMGVNYEPNQRHLINMDKDSTECILLSKLPCILGKMSECADVILKDKSISRMHARIFEEDGELYIQDLNSTNGTFLNGIQLETNEILKIKVGDEIRFGNLRYRYE